MAILYFAIVISCLFSLSSLFRFVQFVFNDKQQQERLKHIWKAIESVYIKKLNDDTEQFYRYWLDHFRFSLSNSTADFVSASSSTQYYSELFLLRFFCPQQNTDSATFMIVFVIDWILIRPIFSWSDTVIAWSKKTATDIRWMGFFFT